MSITRGNAKALRDLVEVRNGSKNSKSGAVLEIDLFLCPSPLELSGGMWARSLLPVSLRFPPVTTQLAAYLRILLASYCADKELFADGMSVDGSSGNRNATQYPSGCAVEYNRGGKRHSAPLRPSPCRASVAQVEFLRRPSCKVRQLARSVTCLKNAALANDTAPSARVSITCAFAPTGFTIARTAGKPATSP
jgi:hypothetical protein